ncbi:MAG: PAS domain S-box protein [Deltaproteobacteria bacterium]|nr:MAG: PAS domain S-box protein [Deltaproteobacteria bacterium]
MNPSAPDNPTIVWPDVFETSFALQIFLDRSGRLLRVNRAALSLFNAYTDDPPGFFRDSPWITEGGLDPAHVDDLLAEVGGGRMVRFEACYSISGEMRFVDWSIKPVNGSGLLLVEGRDITDYELVSRENLQLKNLYDILSRINSTILQVEDEELLLQQVCDIAASIEEIALAWIGFVPEDGGRVAPMAWAGVALPAIHEFHLDEGGRGTCLGTLSSDSEPMVIDDLAAEPSFTACREVLAEFGLASMAAFPLVREERVCGLFVVYSQERGFFRGGRRGLLEEMVANTSFALGTLARETRRREVEQALRTSEQRYRDLVEHARSVILRIDPEGVVTYANPFAEELFGFSADELVGRPVWQTIVHDVEDGGRNLKLMVQRVLDHPDNYQENVNQNVCKDGRRLWISWSNKPVRDAAGNLTEILSIGHDITATRQQAEALERKACEEELRGCLLRLALQPLNLDDFLQQALDALVETPWLSLADKGALFRVDPLAEELVLVAQHQLQPRQLKACARVPFGQCLCGRVALGGKSYIGDHGPGQPARFEAGGIHGHVILPLKSGADLVGVLCLYTLPGLKPGPENLALLETCADILAVGIGRRLGEQALREQETLLRNLIDTIPLPIFYKDTDLVYRGCNDAFAEGVIGLPKEQIIGRNMYDIAPRDLARLYEDADNEVLRTGGTQTYQTEVRFADDSRRSVIIHKAVMEREDGTPFGIVGAILDLSDHQRLEEQLRHAQKVEALGTLTGGVAHDFNNFLTAIMGYASILKMKLPPDAEMSQIVDQVLETTERASRLTYSLLAYSRKQTSKPRPIDFNQVVRGLEKMLRRVLPETIELESRLSDQTLLVMADLSQMEQVLMNLVTNARDAMPSGGRLLIETGQESVDENFVRLHGFGVPGPYAWLRVTDTGCGMPHEVAERIFDPFFTTKPVGRGTGLGLSVSYGIVRQHHGGFVVASEPNNGTSFTVYLPRTERIAGAEEATTSHLAIGGSELLLVVEDDPAVRQVTKSVLEEVGYRVLAAEDGVEGLSLFEQSADKIALVLTDIIMPNMTGLEMYQKIRATHPETRFIFFSGYTFDALEDHGIDKDELDIVFKPVAPMELLGRIRKAIDGQAV